MRATSRACAILLALFALVPAARADVVSDLSAHAGQTVDLASNPTLKSELVNAGLVDKNATSITVNSELMSKAFAYQRFENQVDVTRYHVGERILVQQNGADGRYTARAEIAAVNPDGTYQVTVWDKVEALTHPEVTTDDYGQAYVRVFSGKQPPNQDKTKVKIVEPDGTIKTEEVASPWLLKQNVRTITLTHEQIDAANGRVEEGAPHSINGYSIDPKNDWVLQQRIEQANELIDKMFKPGTLALPADAAGRKAALDKISKLQEKFLDEVFKQNYMEHPGNDEPSDPKTSRRLQQVLKDHPELRGKVGSLLLAQYGVCTEQAAAIASVVEHVAGRIGLTIRPFLGPTIDAGAMHGFNIIRFANGVMGMYDVTWHFIDEADRVHSVDNLDFATYDKRPDSNRHFHETTRGTTNPTSFVDRTSTRAVDLNRGYDHTSGEAYLAVATKETVTQKNITFEQAATEVLSGNTSFERIGGNFTADVIAGRARGIDVKSHGLISTLDHATDLAKQRAGEAVDPAGKVGER
jgi:hypothetical protein